MRGTDYLALADSLARLERECRHARVALNLILAEQDREASKPSRWPDAAFRHAVPQPEDSPVFGHEPPLSPHICYEACDDLEEPA